MKNVIVWILVSWLGSAAAQPSASANQFGIAKYDVLTVGELVARSKGQDVDVLRESVSTVVIFIPGILGSKLKFKEYEFGRDPISAKHLIFDPANDARPTAETLNDFSISGLSNTVLKRFSRQDIYGESLDTLQRLNGGKPIEEFAYDWRADIDESAAELQRWIKAKNLGKKNVVFVAHSMGGLVLWRWLQKVRKQGVDEPLVRQAVFVGSPLQGTCEAARLLIQGYRATEGAGTFESIVTKHLFDDAHAALLTFPSVFQLLPKYSAQKPCIRFLAKDGVADAQDHHEPGFWLGRKGGASGLLVENSKLWPLLVKASGLSDAAYQRRILEAIIAGEKFRKDFSFRPPSDIQISFLASDQESMLPAYEVEFDKASTWFAIGRRAETGNFANGDGRVLSSSAFNFGPLAPNIARHPIKGDHGALLKHPSFLAFMRSNITPLVTEGWAVMVGALLRSAKYRSEARSQQIIVDPGLPGRVLSAQAMMAQYTIADFNAQVLAPDSTTPAQSLVKLGVGDIAGSSTVFALRYKSALIESAALLDAESVPTAGILELRNSRLALGETEFFNGSAIRFDMKLGGDKWKRHLLVGLPAK